MTPVTTPGTAVASVMRAMRVLQSFADHPRGVTLTRLAAQLGYGKASLSKILGTMEREGFVRRDAAGHFTLGFRLLALAFGHAERVGIPNVCAPVLQALADDTNELVQLAVVEHGSVIFVAKAEGRDQRMRMVPLVGLAPPPHATASGKVWLASLPPTQVSAVLGRRKLTRIGPRTITSVPRLLAHLADVRARGYAIVDEELAEGGRAVAVPIETAGRVVGAVAVSGPAFRLPIDKLERMVPRIRRAVADLGAVWMHDVASRDFGLGVQPWSDRGRRRGSGGEA
jgi:DNA-binding IclR family transcriptional regulator